MPCHRRTRPQFRRLPIHQPRQHVTQIHPGQRPQPPAVSSSRRFWDRGAIFGNTRIVSFLPLNDSWQRNCFWRRDPRQTILVAASRLVINGLRAPGFPHFGFVSVTICTDVRAGSTGTRRGSAGARRGSSSDSCSDYFRHHIEAAHEKPRERGFCKVHIPSAPLRLRPDPESGPDHRRPRQAGTDRSQTPRRSCAVSRPRPELLELYLKQGRGGPHEVVRKLSSDSRGCPRPRQSPRTNYGPHGGTATRGGCSHGAVQNRTSTGFSRWWTVGSFTPRRVSCRRSKRQAGAEGGVAAGGVDAGAVEAVVAVRQVGDASV